MTDNFILEANNFFQPGECQRFIDYFEYMNNAGLAISRTANTTQKSHEIHDKQVFFHDMPKPDNIYVKLHDATLVSTFVNRFFKIAYPQYANTYSILQDCPTHRIYAIKLQRTAIGEGYHIWHFEEQGAHGFGRVLFFILYLNTIEEGGETEFLYYHKRVKAEQGKLLVAPCGFPHTHRGNPPLDDNKYVLTGWVDYE